MKMKSLLSNLCLIALLALCVSGCDRNEKSRVPTVPETPEHLTMTNTLSSVDLNWGSTDFTQRYDVYRCPIDGGTKKCPTVQQDNCGAAVATVKSTHYSDTSLTNTDFFCYRIVACNDDNCSEQSPPAMGLLARPAQLNLSVSATAQAIESQTVDLHSFVRNSEGSLTYDWQQTGGTTVSLSTTNAASASFVAPDISNSETLSFSLTATDDNGPVIKSLSIIINPDNVTANAGSDAVTAEGSTIALHGAGSGAGGSPSYSWQQVSGPTVTLTGANSANPSFVAPDVSSGFALLTFELTFNDGIASARDTVTVKVMDNPPALQPSQAAKPLTPHLIQRREPLLAIAPPPVSVSHNTSQRLVATARGGDSDYSWSWAVSNSTVGAPALSFPNGSDKPVLDIDIPTVTGPTQYTLTITVTDHSGASDDGTVELHVNNGPAQTPLVVYAPHQSALENHRATISVSVSGGTAPYTLQWQQRSNQGPAVTLAQPADTEIIEFLVPALTNDEDIIFDVTATDANGLTSTVEQRVTLTHILSAVHKDPVLQLQAIPAVSIIAGYSIPLSAVATGGDGQYSWQWTQTGGTTATLSNNDTSSVTLTPAVVNVAETLTFEVTVTDGNNSSVSETVTVNVDAVATTAPLSITTQPDIWGYEGDQNLTLAALAQGGTGNYQYQWAVQNMTPRSNAALVFNSGLDQSVVGFDLPPVSGPTVWKFTLTVDDGNTSVSDIVIVIAKDLASTLNLGHLNTLTAKPGHTVHLQGAGVQGGKAPYTYSWAQTGGTPSVSLSNVDTVNPSFVVPNNITDYTVLHFTLTVTDSVGNVTSSEEAVRIIPDLDVTLDGPDKVPYEGQLTLHTTVHGGTPPYTYHYSGDFYTSTLQSLQGANPGFTVQPVPSVIVIHDIKVTVTDSTGLHATSTAIEIALQPGLHPAYGSAATDAHGHPLPTTAFLCNDGSGFANPSYPLDDTAQTPCSDQQLVMGGFDHSQEQTCPADRPYALSAVYQDAGTTGSDIIHVTGCASAQTCTKYYQAEISNPQCLNFDPSYQVSSDLVCHYCCSGTVDFNGDGDQYPCNIETMPPDENRFRP